MTKFKLILGAVSVATILGGTFTVSALQGQPEPKPVPQSVQSTANVNKPAASVDIVASDVNEKASDTTTAPAPIKPNTYVIPSTKDGYGTPLLEVTAAPSDTQHRSDGYDNMCYVLNDGTYTAVIVSGYDPTDTQLFPYLGDIDVATGAPATAVGSQQWCAAHDPNKAAL